MSRKQSPPQEGLVGVIPTLEVASLDEATEFYSRLGFGVQWTYPEGTSPTHAGLGWGTVTLMLALAEPGRRIERQNLYFIVRDVDGYRGRLLAESGLRVPPAVDSDYGMRDFAITDPWGHLLTFGQECSE